MEQHRQIGRRMMAPAKFAAKLKITVILCLLPALAAHPSDDTLRDLERAHLGLEAAFGTLEDIEAQLGEIGDPDFDQEALRELSRIDRFFRGLARRLEVPGVIDEVLDDDPPIRFHGDRPPVLLWEDDLSEDLVRETIERMEGVARFLMERLAEEDPGEVHNLGQVLGTVENEQITVEELKIPQKNLVRSRRVELDTPVFESLPEHIDEAPPKVTLTLRLFDDTEYEVVLEEAERGSDGEILYSGRVIDMEFSEVLLIARPAIQSLHGFLQTDTGSFEIHPESAGLLQVYELATESFEDHLEGDEFDDGASRPADTSSGNTSSGDTPQQPVTGQSDPQPAGPDVVKEAFSQLINVVVLYTDALLATYGGAEDRVRDRVSMAVKRANDSYENSENQTRLMVTLIARTTHKETANLETDVDTFPNAKVEIIGRDGQKSERTVDEIRKIFGADLVVMFVDSGDRCGRAAAVGADASNAYAVVRSSCAVTNLSFAHEVGHLQGAKHDKVDRKPWDKSSNYGYYDATNKFRTVMSRDCPEKGCTRVPYFSNPSIAYKGNPTGEPGRSDNRGKLEETARTVATLATLGQREIGDEFGAALASGDFNGDGEIDLAVGSPGDERGRGSVLIFKGTKWGFAPWQSFGPGGPRAISKDDAASKATSTRFGAKLKADDFDGDGKSDLAVAADKVYVFKGGRWGLEAWDDPSQQPTVGDIIETSITTSFDGDDIDDVAIGVPGDDGKGAIFVFQGTSSEQFEARYLLREDTTYPVTAPFSISANDVDSVWLVASPDKDGNGVTIAQTPDTFRLDTVSEKAEHGTRTLKKGQHYDVTMRGTFTIWNKLENPKGSPEAQPIFPSESTKSETEKKVGVDPAYVFAWPGGSSLTGSPPVKRSQIRYSLDGKKTWNVPSFSEDYNLDHRYSFQVEGGGHPLHVKFDDSRFDDNHGAVQIEIEPTDP